MKDEKQNDRFPSNSINHNQPERQRAKEVKPVVSRGRARTKKKGIIEGFTERFLAMDPKSAVESTFKEVLMPAALDTFVDMVEGAANRMAYGDGRKNRSNYRSGSTYNTIYTDRRRRENDIPQHERTAGFSRELEFPTREECVDVYEQINEIYQNYDGVVSVMDLYSSAGLPTSPEQDKWGWFSLEGVKIQKTRECWILSMPKPQRID